VLNSILLSLATRVTIGSTPASSMAQTTYQPYTFTTLAGGGGFKSPEVPGTAARFRISSAVAVDSSGSLYVADTFNHAIRKLTLIGTNWVVTTLGGGSSAEALTENNERPRTCALVITTNVRFHSRDPLSVNELRWCAVGVQ
jgi:TRAP-type C4-dicarboxylate transport system permease large subunit